MSNRARHYGISTGDADAEPSVEPQPLAVRSDRWVPAQKLRARERAAFLDERGARVVLAYQVHPPRVSPRFQCAYAYTRAHARTQRRHATQPRARR
jgi:hypothetical protein